MSSEEDPSPTTQPDEPFTLHWFTNPNSTFVILARKWEHGNQSGFTPVERFVVSGDLGSTRVEKEVGSIDSEQIARMLAAGELKYIGTKGA
jgi:hypothetical protein